MERDERYRDGGVPLVARAVPAVFGLIGLTVCVFLWAAPFDEFGSPPLFFRVFGSLIGVVFMLVGFRGAISGGRSPFGRGGSRARPGTPGRAAEEFPVGYSCPNCGAGLESEADVSPSGDAKCSFCDRWFNIHRALP